MRYVVEISDADGTAFRVRLSVPFLTAWPSEGSWRVLWEGYLRYRSGVCLCSKFGPDPTPVYLSVAGSPCGLRIDGMFDDWGLANDSGEGSVSQAWCVGLKPGPISWALIE